MAILTASRQPTVVACGLCRAPSALGTGYLLAVVTKTQWVTGEDWCWGWEEEQPHWGRRGGGKNEGRKELLDRDTIGWSTPCIISLDPHFSLMEERRAGRGSSTGMRGGYWVCWSQNCAWRERDREGKNNLLGDQELCCLPATDSSSSAQGGDENSL